jgi:hypothetical protein
LAWKIIDGNLPFKDKFAQRATGFNEYPNALWRKRNNNLPYKNMFPVLYSVDDSPS